jgi:hypothetical protein
MIDEDAELRTGNEAQTLNGLVPLKLDKLPNPISLAPLLDFC